MEKTNLSPQAPVWSYPMESIGPITCTKDGTYIVGGALSGNAYVWEITNGRLVRTWCAHHKSVTCLTFSNDDSFLISGSEDGMIIIWPMIGLVDETDCWTVPLILNFSLEHSSSITGLLTASNSSSSIFLSSSLDGTCKVWDLVTGRLLQTRAFPLLITAIVVDPTDKKLFSGSADGTIFLNTLDFGVVEDTSIVLEDEPTLLMGHNGSVTTLTCCGLGLVSASEDCTACLWDVVNCVIIRRFNHLKGFITNLVVIPQLSLFPRMNHNYKTFNQFRVSVLHKYPKPANSSEGVLTYLPSSSSRDKGHCIASEFRTTDLLKQQILELEQPSNVSLTIVQRKRKIANVVEQGKEHQHHPEPQGS
ncbi:protein ROOT INITIATION DEFECTIVE 3-like [Camellia sinensis]|uniref:protein ROOT INITIATION DEFECTIVE 3-like n=1 Tax=Camellia sinensis TaxID=4442 RepID=UPI00103600EE|nr:protein ROOT INITIATION DEFECTIVE 3-like [Camellia sinensis]